MANTLLNISMNQYAQAHKHLCPIIDKYSIVVCKMVLDRSITRSNSCAKAVFENREPLNIHLREKI